MSRQLLVPIVLIVTAVMPGPAPAAEPAAGGAARVSQPSERRQGFDVLLAGVAAAADKGAPQPGWRDPEIEAALTKLIDEVKAATGQEGLALPVTFADVAPAGDMPRHPRTRNQLWVGKDGNLGFAERSILLADGSLRVAHATECVIVARGAVDIAHGRGNVVLAGQFIQVSHDGSPIAARRPGAEGAAGGSLLVCGGVIDVSHGQGTTFVSPKLVRLGFAHVPATFLNTPNVEGARMPPHRAGANRSINVPAAELSMAPSMRPNPLEGRIDITQVVSHGGEKADLAVHQVDGRELVIRTGSEPRDLAGNVLPGFEGWKLAFVSDGVALFSSGRDDAVFHIPRRQ